MVREILTNFLVALLGVTLSTTPVPAPLVSHNFAIPTAPVTDSEPVPQPKKLVLVDKFVVDKKATATVTGYTNSFVDTGKTPGSEGYGITSTGNHTRQGRTIAVDPKLIPYGSIVRINGNLYVAEDCGGAIRGYAIDMFFNRRRDALQWGRRHLPIEIGHLEKQWVLTAA